MQTQLINARMNKESIVNIITDNMKKHFILLCIVLLNITAYAQGQGLVLISRLINSNSETFIELTLKNTSTGDRYIFSNLSDSNTPTGPINCILKSEVEYKDGIIRNSNKQGFMYFNDGEKIFILKAQNSYKYKIPLLYHSDPNSITGVMGVVSRSDIGDVKRVRFLLDQVKAVKKGNNIEKIDTTLYSNWIDIK
jgi:hypothetical protein